MIGTKKFSDATLLFVSSVQPW